MTWTKLGDEFADETMALSSDAFRLHVEALIWSNKRLADLIVPRRMLPRLSALDDPEAAAAELLAAGWWQDMDVGYWIGCRFSDWQRDRADVEHDRERNARNQRRRRLHLRGDHSECLPGKCRAPSPGDTPDDSHHDYADTSGRVGSGREVTANPALEEREVTEPRSDTCRTCGQLSGFSLLDGRCRRCLGNRQAS